MRPTYSTWMLRLKLCLPNLAAVGTAGLAGAIAAASAVIQAESQSHRESRADQHIAHHMSVMRRRSFATTAVADKLASKTSEGSATDAQEAHRT